MTNKALFILQFLFKVNNLMEKEARFRHNTWGSMDIKFFMLIDPHALCLKPTFFFTKLLTLQRNCKYKQCFICHALSYSRLRANLETKNMSGKERVMLQAKISGL